MTHRFITSQSEVDTLLPALMEKPSWGWDTETTGLDALKDKVVLVTLARPEAQYVIDTRRVSLEPIRPFFESRAHKKIAHHAKFDYKMMKMTFGIEVEESRCTMLADKIYNNGRKFHGFSLAQLLSEWLGIELNKELQKSFIGHKGDFSPAQIKYAADDGVHLLALAQKLSAALQRDQQHHVWHLENQVTPCFGDMELGGFHLDVEGWKRQMQANLEAAEAAKKALGEICAPLFGTDLFGETTINFRSPDQCLDVLKRMRVKIKQEDRDGNTQTLDVTDTSDATLMQLQHYPVVKHMQDYRSYMTRLSSFGQGYLDAIRPETGKVHFEVDQLGTETGRPAKSGKGAVNPLNVPKENTYRHCWRAPEGYLAETDDFSGCELRIWAELSGDPGLREAFNRGIDVHCYVASKLFRKDVPKKGPGSELRTPVKALNFGIAYGMGPKKLYLKLNGEGYPISFRDARKLYNDYCTEFKVGVDFLREVGRGAAKQGWTANLNGRRRYWILPNPDDHTKYPKGREDEKFLGRMGGIEREGGNMHIQSLNAEMTKTAMVSMRDYKKASGIRMEFFNQVYDEVDTFTHKDDSAGWVEKKRQFMKDAAHKWMKSVKMDVDGHVEPYWTKG